MNLRFPQRQPLAPSNYAPDLLVEVEDAITTKNRFPQAAVQRLSVTGQAR